ncbi:hypothetical protein QE152_g4073 [Popillia japonica]|uniref:Uncharacterized protein n=1 Tax=Popillia japonica TaxID=7064 RepID=A0AAW1N265_POPJA
MGTLCFRIKARGISGKRESKDSKIPAIATVKQAMEMKIHSKRAWIIFIENSVVGIVNRILQILINTYWSI